MTISISFALLLSLLPGPAQTAAPTYVVSILNERAGDTVSVRFVLSGPPNSYSATKDGGDVVVRIAAVALPGLGLPVARSPIRGLTLESGSEFTLRVALEGSHAHEMVRDLSSVSLVLRPVAPAQETPKSDTVTPAPDPGPSPGVSRGRETNRVGEAGGVDTLDLYQRLFPSTGTPSQGAEGGMEAGKNENWYSDFSWLGLQARPWVSVSYVDGRTTQVQSNNVTGDSYWVIQPNLGIGFSPVFGGSKEGQWTLNYTPRFRRLVDLNLPRLTSHFFDFGLDQPVASFGSVYGTYHFSKGVLETEEIDGGREYGIGLNRVIDTSLERFRRNSFGLGLRFDFVADTQVDVNVSKTAVRYGNVAADKPFQFGARAFFDYDARTLNAALRRGLGESRFLSLLYGIHDTPAQKERKQVEGRGYTYGASLEGDIAALTTGRILFGYRTQKNPNAGAGGQDYKDITYGAQLLREITEETSLGVSADRKLYLSAYAENGFYVADSIRGDLSTRLPLGLSLRGSAGHQANNYRASPQSNTGSSDAVLRNDKIRYWSVGLARSFAEWAYLRFDYISERRNSNLDRFDIKTRALTFQLGVGFFGKGGGQVQSSW